jgi:hypothetical protein
MRSFHLTMALPLSLLSAACGEQTAMKFDIESVGRLKSFDVSTNAEAGKTETDLTDATGFESADLSPLDAAGVFDSISADDDCDTACAGDLSQSETQVLESAPITAGGNPDDAEVESNMIEVESNIADHEDPNPSEINACAELNGVKADSIRLVGNQTQLKISSASVIAIKLTGNQSTLSLELRGPAPTKIAGICVFLAGNESDALIVNHIQVGRLIYVGRGNQSHTEFLTIAGASLGDVVGDLSGNQAGLSISGDGEYNCGNVRLKGRSSTYACQ